jgi:hypothetical protein
MLPNRVSALRWLPAGRLIACHISSKDFGRKKLLSVGGIWPYRLNVFLSSEINRALALLEHSCHLSFFAAIMLTFEICNVQLGVSAGHSPQPADHGLMFALHK